MCPIAGSPQRAPGRCCAERAQGGCRGLQRIHGASGSARHSLAPSPATALRRRAPPNNPRYSNGFCRLCMLSLFTKWINLVKWRPVQCILCPLCTTEEYPLSAVSCRASMRSMHGAGGVAGTASSVIREERATLTNIHALLEALHQQQHTLLADVDSKEVRAALFILQTLPCCCKRLDPSTVPTLYGVASIGNPALPDVCSSVRARVRDAGFWQLVRYIILCHWSGLLL
jgi:hypothetical protein